MLTIFVGRSGNGRRTVTDGRTGGSHRLRAGWRRQWAVHDNNLGVGQALVPH
jgi:hypothetical protein